MANQEQMEILKQGVEVWNTWRKSNTTIIPDLSEADLSEAVLPEINLSATNLYEARLNNTNLRDATFVGADLRKAILINANLIKTKFGKAKLNEANLSGAEMMEAELIKANLEGACLIGVDLSDASLREANLSRAIFQHAELQEADFRPYTLQEGGAIKFWLDDGYTRQNFAGAIFREANLREATFRGADLRNADFSAANLSGVDFRGANLSNTRLTGACVEGWNISSDTKTVNVLCDYIYRRRLYQERRPSNGFFAPGQFSALFQQASETVELIFADGIDWQAFFQSFQELRSQYDDLSIQAIEKKSGGAFVIRLEVLPETNEVGKAEIERHVKELYKMRLQLQEERYRIELNAKEREIELYKKQSARMDKIVELLATREEPKVSLRPDQLKILQCISAGANSSDEISRTTGISLDLARYYIEALQTEGYLQCSEYNDGFSIDNHYLCHITNKGRVAITNPDLLLPLKQPVASQTTIHAQTVGAIHSGSGDITGFTMNINSNIDDITKLITALRDTAQTFPEAQREEALEHLGDVEESIRQPDKVKPHRIKAALAALLAIAGMVAATTDFSNNVLEIGNKLGIELIQPHSK